MLVRYAAFEYAMDIRSQLRGAWRVDRKIVGGVETPKLDDYQPFLWFTDEVMITGNADAAWDMHYTVLGSSVPAKIDYTRNDRWEPWVERAIVEVEVNTLRLCSAGSADKGRPDSFQSTAANGWTLYLATRCDEPVPE